MKTKFFILCYIVSTNVYAQSKCDCFDRLYSLSTYYYVANNWPMMVSTLKDGMAFLDKEKAGDFYFDLARGYSHFDADSAMLYFTKAMQRGYPAKWIQSEFPELFKKLDPDKIRQYTADSRSKINFDLYDKFVQVLAIDQVIRDGTLYPESYVHHGTPEQKAIIDTMFSRVDSATYEFVKMVLDEYQFPSEHDLGFYPSGFMGLILHITSENNKRSQAILDKLEELNSMCAYPQKSNILALKDRQRLYTTGKSYVGLMGYKRFEFIEDVTKADSIRFQYNQIRIEEEVSGSDSTAKKDKAELYKKGYKPISYPPNYFCNKKYNFK